MSTDKKTNHMLLCEYVVYAIRYTYYNKYFTNSKENSLNRIEENTPHTLGLFDMDLGFFS